MRIISAVQAREVEFNCETWSRIPTNASRDDIRLGGFVHDVYEAPIAGAFDRAVDALLAYRIFAAHRIYARVCTSDRRVAVGATIVQRAVLGPLAIETAVRVIELVRTVDSVLFTYATLHGHPEKGIASFAVIRTAGASKFEAQAWSRAGNWLTMIGRPLSRVMQRALTREAVRSFVDLANQDAEPKA